MLTESEIKAYTVDIPNDIQKLQSEPPVAGSAIGSATIPYLVQIPANHNITGTCGSCGWPIISPMLWAGTGTPNEWCVNCGKHPKPIIAPHYGPVREMLPNVGDERRKP